MTAQDDDIIDVTPTELDPEAQLPAAPEAAGLVPLEALPPEKQEQARELMAKIDLNDTQSILAFGVEAQKAVSDSADRMLGQTRNKDVGPVGQT